VVILHSVGESLPYVIENGLNEIEPLFSAYIRQLEEIQEMLRP
jgi:hypothetical protein